VDAEVEDTGNEAEAAVPVNTSVRFTFTMESLIVDLFIGGSKEVCLLQVNFSLFLFHFSFLSFAIVFSLLCYILHYVNILDTVF
jgi:hypothetical protein